MKNRIRIETFELVFEEFSTDGYLSTNGYLSFENMSNNIYDGKSYDFKLAEDLSWSNPSISLNNLKNCPKYAKYGYKLDASFNSNEELDHLNFYKYNKLILMISTKNMKYLCKIYNKEGIVQNLGNKNSDFFVNKNPYGHRSIYINSKYLNLF